MATWIVTGATRGIGLAFARALVQRGERVVGTARRPESAEELRSTGARVEKLDVADDASVADFARRLANESVDVLIHNAAIGDAGPSIEHLDPGEVLRTLDVNAVGPVRLTRALLTNLRAGRTRKIVGITSGLGSLQQDTGGGWYAYRMAKAALNMFIRTLAEELAPERFACVVICPGWVKTAMGGPEAPLTPEESVAAMLKVIDRLTPSDTGRFLDRRGRDMPW
ncbi:MAG TPA: SDR family oxidoreductase [Thermoanaerobaculia bacterium]|jgi:NAD(P)-dependent dehydrogenase (short-subunit alcohol dehydrogenase family)|nr:SDR family oxidoreductase [Thermoanaerobaculia bacterium]